MTRTRPEDIPLAQENIREVRRSLKVGEQRLKDYDDAPKAVRLFDALPDDDREQPDPGYTRDPEEDDFQEDE